MKRTNDRKMQDIKSQIDRSKVEQDQYRMSAATEQEVAIVKAEQVCNVLITQVEGQKLTAQSQIQANVVEIVNRARAAATNQVTMAKQQADVQTIQAEARLAATRAQYSALAEEGRSEAQNLEAFDAQRRHEFEMKKAAVYQGFAMEQKNIVISGETGDSLLQSLIDLSLDGSDKKMGLPKKK